MARILIIDDDPDIIDYLQIVLEGAGHDVHTKMDTGQLVESVTAIAPDLVVLDVMFPEDPQGGFVAARALRREPKTARIPVLVLSAVNQLSSLSFGFSDHDISDDFMPVDAFIEKPVDPETLLMRIEKALTP